MAFEPTVVAMGYLTESPYSPFHLERELPNRNWRNAFEDLLTLESGGEMISDEKQGAGNGCCCEIQLGKGKPLHRNPQ